MVVTSIGDETGEVTLLYTLGAARSFADPSAVDAFVRTHGIENEYSLRDWDKWGTLVDIKEATDTPRHVFVGTSRGDRRLAENVGWEYLTAREAAAKAGWELGEPEPPERPTGVVGPLRRLVTGRSWWPF